jgi:SAM-dependent methyltransferase
MNKNNLRYVRASDLIPKDTKSVLDVGCRDAILKQYLPKTLSYTGADIFPGPGVDYICNLEKGLPFEDGTYDTVTALDVLEHTDDIWHSFEELVRVARKHVVIVFPNMYHWSFRLWYLRGKEMAKYQLPSEQILDRHRWLVSYDTAYRFSLDMASKLNLTMTTEPMFGPRRHRPMDLFFGIFSKNLSCWSVAFVFSKKQ